MKKTIYTIGLASLVTFASFAKTNKSTADSTQPDEGKFVVSGYIDTYYQHNFNSPSSGNSMGYIANSPAGVNYMRAFDRMNDQFSLGLVQTKFAYTNNRSEMVVDLTFGPNAELGNFGNTLGGAKSYVPVNSIQGSVYGSSAAIKQAYFLYRFTSKLSMTVGQFGTHIGYEVIDAPVNYHYSLSNLFNNGPFYHIGAKMNYALNDKVGFMLGLVNNWDALTDWKTQKSVIGQVFINPIKGLNIYVNGIGGFNDDPFRVQPSRNFNSPSSNPINVTYTNLNYTRMLFDLTSGYQVSTKFYVGINAAYGQYQFKGEKSALDAFKLVNEDKSTLPWYGVALYSNYAINSMVGIGARFEHFNDEYKVRYANTVNNSLTITAPITLANGHVIFKPEFRADVSPEAVYEGKIDSNTGFASTRRNQTTIGMSFIYKY